MMVFIGFCLFFSVPIAFLILFLMELPEKRRKKEWEQYWKQQDAIIEAEHNAKWKVFTEERTKEVEELSKPYLEKYPVKDPDNLVNCFVLERKEGLIPEPYFYDENGIKCKVDLEKGEYLFNYSWFFL